MASFQLLWTGDSAAETIRVPIWMPSAPIAKAAAMVLPSTNPPAAMMGTSTFERTSGSNTMVATSRGFLKPPPSLPSTINPSTPASTAFNAAWRVGTTWKTVKPADLSWAVYFVGLPADVVTNVTPCSITKSAMAGSRTNAWAIFTPKGLSVRVRMRLISSLITSSSPELVSIIPMPPALDTAEANCDRAIHPMGA